MDEPSLNITTLTGFHWFDLKCSFFADHREWIVGEMMHSNGENTNEFTSV